MNRRNFIFKSALATFGVFNILPGAGRIWKAEHVIHTQRIYSYSHYALTHQIANKTTLPDFLKQGDMVLDSTYNMLFVVADNSKYQKEYPHYNLPSMFLRLTDVS